MKKFSHSKILYGWKEISTYLERSPNTCRNWHEENKLPIHSAGKKSNTSVWAFTDELDNWLRSKETLETNSQETAAPSSQDSHKGLILLLLLVFITSVTILITSNINHHSGADQRNFHINGSKLFIEDCNGKSISEFETGIPNLIPESEYKRFSQSRKKIRSLIGYSVRPPYTIVQDINNDNKNELLFSVQTIDESNEGLLICIDDKGNQLWRIQTGKKMVFGSQEYSSDYRIYGIYTEDLNNDGNLEIIVISWHRLFFPCQLLVVNSYGKVMGEFWNSGYISDVGFADTDGDHQKEIIFGGINNETKSPFIAVIDCVNDICCSPQQNQKYSCGELDNYCINGYIFLPKAKEITENPLTDSIYSIEIMSNNRIFAFARHSELIFETNFKFSQVKIHTSHNFERKFQSYSAKKSNPESMEQYFSDLSKKIRFFRPH